MAAGKKLALLTLEQILQAEDLPTKTLDVPSWGGSVEYRGLKKQEHNDAQGYAVVNGQTNDARFEDAVLAAGLVNPKVTVEQVAQLRQKNVGAVDEIIAAILDASGMTARMVAALEAAFRDAA